MGIRHLAWTLAALLHQALVVAGAAYLSFDGRGLALGLVAQYCDVTGADTSYGFFAPAVASACRAELTLRDAQGRTRTDTLVEDPSAHFAWRTSSAVDAIPRMPEKLKRSLAGSWAAVQFGRHPDATEVVVDVQLEALPTMAEWREGARPRWTTIYTSTFGRREPSGEQRRGR